MSDPKDADEPTMDELQRRRMALEDKVAARNAEIDKQNQKDARRGDSAGWARGLKLASEFVAGILVGAAIGWGLDWVFGTLPWFFIAFLMLGFGAGILNVLRAEGMASPK
ncbi:MAG: AtpZ/AtpI family protein [Pseudomonadota bacterium]